MNYAIIADNEIRKSGYFYDNLTGDHYTFPHKYKSWLKEGTIVIYYKSKRQKGEHRGRLSEDAHYFGVARIDDVYYLSKEGNNNMYVAQITGYVPFKKAVPFRKDNGRHYERDATSWDIQSWRNGVRQIDEDIYQAILNDSGLSTLPSFPDILKDSEGESLEYSSLVFEEGREIKIYSTKYERNIHIRQKVLALKGYSCSVCGFNFEEAYGDIGHEFIHVHHNKPLALGIRNSKIASDFDVVCPNCHAMLHKQQGKCLTVQELKKLLKINHDKNTSTD